MPLSPNPCNFCETFGTRPCVMCSNYFCINCIRQEPTTKIAEYIFNNNITWFCGCHRTFPTHRRELTEEEIGEDSDQSSSRSSYSGSSASGQVEENKTEVVSKLLALQLERKRIENIRNRRVERGEYLRKKEEIRSNNSKKNEEENKRNSKTAFDKDRKKVTFEDERKRKDRENKIQKAAENMDATLEDDDFEIKKLDLSLNLDDFWQNLKKSPCVSKQESSDEARLIISSQSKEYRKYSSRSTFTKLTFVTASENLENKNLSISHDPQNRVFPVNEQKNEAVLEYLNSSMETEAGRVNEDFVEVEDCVHCKPSIAPLTKENVKILSFEEKENQKEKRRKKPSLFATLAALFSKRKGKLSKLERRFCELENQKIEEQQKIEEKRFSPQKEYMGNILQTPGQISGPLNIYYPFPR